MRKKKQLLALVPILGLVILFGGLYIAVGFRGNPSEGGLEVVVSFYPLAYMAEQIGGEKVTVTSLIKPGVETHSWQPSMQDIFITNAARMIIYNGAGFNNWMQDDVIPSIDGQCQLQNLVYEYGVAENPFKGPKANLPTDHVSLFIERNLNRCILCGMCVRACETIVGASAISFIERGTERRVSTPFGEESEACIGCTACAYFCPTGAITVEDKYGRKVIHDEMLLGPTTAIRVPIRQAVPMVPFIDEKACIHFKTGACQVCAKVCDREAVKHDMQDEVVELGPSPPTCRGVLTELMRPLVIWIPVLFAAFPDCHG